MAGALGLAPAAPLTRTRAHAHPSAASSFLFRWGQITTLIPHVGEIIIFFFSERTAPGHSERSQSLRFGRARNINPLVRSHWRPHLLGLMEYLYCDIGRENAIMAPGVGGWVAVSVC